jgi:hypothetical protein
MLLPEPQLGALPDFAEPVPGDSIAGLNVHHKG